MTRQQVAKRLGKSLATVRRLEGVRLRPVQDARGVHHFDAAEVDRVARDIENGDVVLWKELRAGFGDSTMTSHGDPCERCAELELELQALREALDEMRLKNHRDVEAVRAAHDRELAKHDIEAHELATHVANLLAVLED